MAENYKHLYEQTKKMLTMYQDELIPGFRKQIEDLEAKSKWIPVTERLPDVAITHKNRWEHSTESVRVLCACLQKSGKRMVKEGSCKVYASGTIYWMIPGTVDSVTHWMPLPEPPKEVE